MITHVEGKRGCGYRKPGGLYLVAAGRGRPCGLLPIALEACPTCGHGIKFSRSWTWVNVAALAAMNPESCQMKSCGDCPLADAKIERAGLIARRHEAQWRHCRIDAAPLKAVADWTERYRHIWEGRLDRLDAYLQQITKKEAKHDRKPRRK